MKVSFEGIGESVVTFYNDSENAAPEGAPVAMSGNGQVSKCADGARFFGVSLACVDGFAAVQTQGYIRLKYSGTAPEVGFGKLSADAVGGVKTDAANGREFLIVDVDTGDKTLGFML